MSTIGVKQKPQVKLPYPHRGQMVVQQQARRFNLLSAGRRWRKTTLAMCVAIEHAMRGQSLLWGAPTFDQVRIGWNETRRACGGYAKFVQQRMTVEFPQGGRIIFRSLDDPDNARGHTGDGIIIDEAGDVKARAWYEVLRPMLIDTKGWAWIIGTPRGRNWFWQEWLNAQDRRTGMAWQVPTLGVEIVDGALRRQPHPLENPDIEFAEIESIFQTTPEDIFRQEILAEFLESEGQVFRNITACLHAPQSTPEGHKGHRVVMGVDWGKQQDFTALSVMCADCKQELALDRFNQIDYHVQRQRLAALAEKWGVTEILAESNAMGEPLIEELQRQGLPVVGFQTTATSKPPLIESLALALEREECQWLDIPVATGELEAYERKVSATTGRSSYSAPEGLHDDTVVARALAWQMCNNVGFMIGFAG